MSEQEENEFYDHLAEIEDEKSSGECSYNYCCTCGTVV